MKETNHILKASPYALASSDECRYRRRRSRPRSACLTVQGQGSDSMSRESNEKANLTEDEAILDSKGDEDVIPLPTLPENLILLKNDADTDRLQRAVSAPDTKPSIRKLALAGKSNGQRPFTAQSTAHHIRTLRNCQQTTKHSIQAWALVPTDRDNLSELRPCGEPPVIKISVKLGCPNAVPKLSVVTNAVRAPRQALSAKGPASHMQRAPFVAAARPRALSTEQRLAHIRELLRKNGGDCAGIDPLLFFEMGEEASSSTLPSLGIRKPPGIPLRPPC